MIHFVGAGCGAKDLITVRGQNLLKQADVVIYAGSLVNPELLEYTKPGCQIHNSAFMTLEEVLTVMYQAFEEKQELVRLHTGDPSIYGAIREQMDFLDSKAIPYDSCPGVSACFGAAAGLNLEYTLPGVSQSLIITRMEGKTSVPEKESIESFARHDSTMAIYLSASNLSELRDRLIAGGYSKDTPCALCYKVSWPEEAYFKCTLENLPELASANHITKTALVLVGKAIAQSDYALSRLYASDFETEFRKASAPQSKLRVCYFTPNGEKICQALAAAPSLSVDVRQSHEALSAWVKESFDKKLPIVFISACGIAVRTIAPFIESKLTDSPVIVIDERGIHITPILSGHVGQANKLALLLANLLGGEAVITTATDLENKFAVDLFAIEHGLEIANKDGIKAVSSKILRGKSVTISITPSAISSPKWKEFAAKLPQLLPPQVELVPFDNSFSDIRIVDSDESPLYADKEAQSILLLMD